MPDSLAILLILFFLLSIGLSISLAAFALADSKAFMEWLPLAGWLYSKMDPRGRFRTFVAGVFGIFFALAALSLSFVFGSLTTTFTFGLWTSPLIRWLEF